MKLSEVYNAGVGVIKSKKASLVDKVVKSFGFAMGIEFRESSLLISSKSEVPAKKGKFFTSTCHKWKHNEAKIVWDI